MNIERKKLIYVPDGSLWWAKTHAMTPTIDIQKDRIRVYFSSLDDNMVGRIGFVDLDKNNPDNILSISQEPIFDIGTDGTFDDNGVIPSSIITYQNRKLLYYHGFQLLRKQVRFLILTGLATSDNGGNTFERNTLVPLLDRNKDDVFIRSLPHVIYEDNLFKIWYSGVNQWTNVKDKILPIGNIRYVESNSYNDFSQSKVIRCLEPQSHEFSLSRPYIFRHNVTYKMLFSCRQRDSDQYKLGYAESKDGKVWNRNDQILRVSKPSGSWDSEMVCYTSIVSVNDKNYLFYNGNQFGSTGFGYAEVSF
jgi:predicted GH43/DUF377 family glycosyl hydrolase